ncbi:MAG: trypsin-like peptidase domain-containing protein [Pseudomonadales bacterium]|nr:trypsin-like peptidase domain-containing protein [Pseudomonadales bacterium]
MKKFLKFISWPALVGALFAVIILQYQQTQKLVLLERQSSPALPSGALPVQSGSYADAVERASPSVISIHSTIRQQIELPPADQIPPVFRSWLQNLPSERSWNSLGSGVVISAEGHILTALHVIEGAENIDVVFGENNNTSMVRATLVGTDPNTDLALLKIDSDLLPPMIPIGSSEGIRVGDEVLAIGFPSQELMNQKSVSKGIVSALGIPQHGLPIVEYIQTDAAMNFGNSGGALINTKGELIGINSFIFSQSGGSDGIGFAVPVNKAMLIADQLIKFGEVTPGYLGVITGEMLTEASSLEFFGRPDINGLLIEQVNTDSPAEQAGIRPGDVMTAIDGVQIGSVIGAIDRINRKAPGETVDMQLYREGRYLIITVELGSGTAQYRSPLSLDRN